MKNNRTRLLSFLAIVALLSFSVGCSDMMLDLQQAIIEVNIDTSPFNDIEGTVYTVTATPIGVRAVGEPISTTESPLVIKPVSRGNWDIEVTASINGELVGEGSSVVRVTQGTASTQPIVINQTRSQLTALSFSNPPTGLDFNSIVFDYPDVTIGYGASEISINASSLSGNITVNDSLVSSGVNSQPISLVVGENTIRVVVTETGKLSQEYTFTVEREIPEVGTRGTSGGYIFYDKGNDSDIWRYLEAAPFGWSGDDEDPEFQWGDSGATKVCADLSIEHNEVIYDDWYLPSKEELELMYENLYKEEIGGLSEGSYWSSSVSGSSTAYYQVFLEETIVLLSNCKTNEFMVRPIRAFSGE
ncbi:MAG: cadherin-like beta sandwich domain-containing protein [Spirochaetia bacterium]|nr:cadherin-like beta sandwich domain-containing protein [Spirochaetia bacterium]